MNEFRFAVNRFVSQNIQTRANKENVAGTLGIPGVDTSIPLFWGIPFIQISNFGSIGECNDCPFVNWNTSFQMKDDFSWNKGRHQVKFGGEARRIRYNQIGAVVPRGRFTWNGQYSNNSMADVLLGYMSNSESQIGAPIANFRENYFGIYLQDAWKEGQQQTDFEPRSLLGGAAAVFRQTRRDREYRLCVGQQPQSGFRTRGYRRPAGTPKFPVGLPFQLVRDGRFGRRAFKSDGNDFAPRFGLAYQLNPKTVIRSGAGIYYFRDISNAVFDIVRNIPFTIRQNEVANSGTPNLSWASRSLKRGRQRLSWRPNSVSRRRTSPNGLSDCKRELSKDSSLEVTYLGSVGIHLRRLQVYNSAQPGPGNTNSRRPFTYLNGNIQTMTAPGHSNYEALHTRFQHRLSHGFTLLSSYAWGRSIDNGSGVRTTDGDALTPSNNYNLKAERGLSAFQFKHRWTNSFLIELPFGKGKRYLGNAGAAANAILGGW